MPLPITFAGLSAATGAELDQNYAALGALTTIPCTVSGTNALALTPLANTPTVSGYANYQAFSCVASATNTGATTATVGSLAALSVYKDKSTGPTALAGGEVVNHNLITLTYDSALNSGAGGFHLRAPLWA